MFTSKAFENLETPSIGSYLYRVKVELFALQATLREQAIPSHIVNHHIGSLTKNLEIVRAKQLTRHCYGYALSIHTFVINAY